ncbi:MAG: hypothetical protein DRQ61_03855 [Gammaproteobacteria bacterium]|nr:MAG: hypothetical protein DRQ56_00565 [Gammaproteobacteria bacterium]RLA23446.1 MAG: hypothetical protein DRQ61_03855 [Gammaproteobacteria bacterium]
MNTLLRTILLSISLMLLPHQTTLADEVDGFAGRDKASQEAVESLEAYAVYKMGNMMRPALSGSHSPPEITPLP